MTEEVYIFGKALMRMPMVGFIFGGCIFDSRILQAEGVAVISLFPMLIPDI
jgi:hypothetical protein